MGYHNMAIGHSYANLTTEIHGRGEDLKHFETDFVYFNHNAIMQLAGTCSLETLILNCCEQMQDETVEFLMNTASSLTRLRLRASNGFTEKTCEHLMAWAEKSSALHVELEPSPTQSQFMLTKLAAVFNDGPASFREDYVPNYQFDFSSIFSLSASTLYIKDSSPVESRRFHFLGSKLAPQRMARQRMRILWAPD